jgi:hypothetical protein
MNELHGLKEALIKQHNEKMAVIARLEILLCIVRKKDPDEIVAKQELKNFAGGTGFVDVNARDFIKTKQEDLDVEYRVLAVIKEMVQECETPPQ